PSIVTPPPVSGGRSSTRTIDLRRSAPANPIVHVPGSLFVASIASRNEIPSGPGFATSASTLDVSPFSLSELVVTRRPACAGASADEAARRRRSAPAAIANLVVDRSSHEEGPVSRALKK